MPIHLECLSHTPLHGYFDPRPDVVAEVERIGRAARERVEAFNPDVIVAFAPDHFNGFFYDVMPPFCIGARAEAIGDFKSLAGTLPVPEALAHRLAENVLDTDIDVALSYRMQVDHGCAQALEVLTGGLDRYPVIPVFINSVAPPMATLRRARLLGDAIGRFFSRSGKRVLVVGSGGISHEPPVPELAGAAPEVAERLIAGRNPTPDSRAARQARTVAAAKSFTAGDSPLHPLNPEWDRAFLARLASGELTSVDGMTNAAITRDGGKSAHEIRTWVAAFGALAAYGPYCASLDYYREIPEWIAGFAAMHATPDAA
ncbi:3-carboxyethylcatechol 2,3-dioxygenase [Paraburkholderia silvatlantica]|uniref:2,3-dihydroxyphenylpropionate/2,3-dihydroxicinnamic acid 1,2-dioxygenase n=1 Tax=Paraburkholderia silvatlantica TaxID=321895 RepID=A0ABR6FWB6_9BURK|nr:3-carboxyethylcatechol 2,3-dioxygenase [Paraburkholderia silvatlantica]MBB2931732.1 2,3-dihydroxyphenylpropionate 1,2-dioxygenase [Paraburkholderia silvatlantica]PVY26380.1 2,3-dihydroxyphenylpropionate 1,2-dioxygenase [Paraburkholderia silvatlantica]PXW32131.1 2,3-dihydroxyphenylpropionate 1,2-dioxygenase [Paraburkholderia silvatlantica]TDQ82711.1 2,3-dihydroxyphenylpropionate 1,2-dioxygenase [Paraburkholderia silvatlantica]